MAQMIYRKMPKMPREETPQQFTERLRKSMQNSSARTNPEAARKFLSQLSMYDKNGQLK